MFLNKSQIGHRELKKIPNVMNFDVHHDCQGLKFVSRNQKSKIAKIEISAKSENPEIQISANKKCMFLKTYESLKIFR